MSMDTHGLLWLSDPMAAALTIVVLTALLLWCQWALLAESKPVRVPVPVRTDEAAAPLRRRHDADRWPAA